MVDTISRLTQGTKSYPLESSSMTDLDENEAIIPSLCLKLSNNKSDLAIDMFSMFCDEIKISLDELDELLANDKQEALSEKVHKLHGAACYTGAPRFKRLCKNFEDKINQTSVTKEELKLGLKNLNDEIHRILLWRDKNNLAELMFNADALKKLV